MVGLEGKGSSAFRSFSSRGEIPKVFWTVNLLWLESYIFGTSKNNTSILDFGGFFLDDLHSRKLTWQWNIIHFDGIYQERWGGSLLSCWFSGDFFHVDFLTLPVFQKSI